MQNYFSKLLKLNARRIDPQLRAKGLYEGYSRLSESEAVKYATGAMQPIDDEYTANTYRESRRVEDQLSDGLTQRQIEFSYKHQGSVTSNTHIKAHSDIDLLVLHDAFISLERPQVPKYPYKGDPLEDLLELRSASIQILTNSFPAAKVDASGDKSIALSGGSLKRKIDVVPSNWYNSNAYACSGKDYDRGVQILDAGKRERVVNYPFLHNEKLDVKDRRFNGNVRKLIRLLKSLKYDADKEVQLSSFDIASTVWNMDDMLLNVAPGYVPLLVTNCDLYLSRLITNEPLRQAIDVPDGTRKVYGQDLKKYVGLVALENELKELLQDIKNEFSRSFRNLAEARLSY